MDEMLVRDDTTKELYMPLSSTIVLQRKKAMLHLPLDFEGGLTINDLVDSRANVSAIAQNDMDTVKQQAPPLSSKSTLPPFFKFK